MQPDAERQVGFDMSPEGYGESIGGGERISITICC